MAEDIEEISDPRIEPATEPAVEPEFAPEAVQIQAAEAAVATAEMRLILASESPRRQSLLREARYEFVVEPSGIDEESYGNLPPSALALRLAIAKAEAVSSRFPDDVVIGADTVVAFGEVVLGKPTDEKHARAMLTLLAGTTHIVITGVAVRRRSGGVAISSRVLSAVRMKNLTAAEIDQYIATNQWQGKAGGYGIQDKDPFVERMSGCLTNIVGLPMKTTRRMLESVGIVPGNPPPGEEE